MSFLESISTSVFGMCVVFVVLIVLSLVITLQSRLVKTFRTGARAPQQAGNDMKIAESVIAVTEAESTGGELKLAGVDEKTAATIMAIVSHESKIPLSELRFKHIKAADSKAF